MSYVIEHIGRTIKGAREARGLSQRALSEKAGVPQSHISKIENGAVDLRVSSLVELGRVLDLELMLVPRKANSAVQSIVRSSAESSLSATDDTARQTLKELKRLQNSVANLSEMYPSVTELAQLQRQVRELAHFRIPRHDLEPIRSAIKAVKAFKNTTAGLNAVREAYSRLRTVRNALAHGIVDRARSEPVRPAYSLDEDDHG
jgi:transcriptional regulator with XRE-family HTH domain